jgi:hypothetical protein
VTLLPQTELPEEALIAQIRLIHDPPPLEERIKFVEALDIQPLDPKQIHSLNESMVAMAVSERQQQNKDAAKDFGRVLREQTNNLLGNKAAFDKDHYVKKGEYPSIDLFALAKRWNIPLLLVHESNIHHWLLGLKPLEKTATGWRILVYDPFAQGSRWFHLPGGSLADYTDPGMYVEASQGTLFTDESTAGMIREKRFDMSLMGDLELANHPDILAAKETNTQFNSYDCGPLVLFGAALRESVRETTNPFQLVGRDQLRNDLEILFLTRDEIPQLHKKK